jgi:FkbM family methyltransferase
MAIFLPYLKATGRLDSIHITICNVGSRKLDEDDEYGRNAWNIFAPHLTIYGFDADPDACEEANAELEIRQINWTEKHIPVAIGPFNGETTLYVTQSTSCSSLYPPNEPFIKHFADLPEYANLDFAIEIETITLDTFLQSEGIESVDFLQIDVQGADLNILEGAIEVLNRSVLAVQIEVEFAHLYQNQPLFSEIDVFLRQHDFHIFDLYTTRRVRECSPIHSNTHPGQLLWGEAFYLRDLLQPTENLRFKTPEKIFKLACLADAMDFSDYALELLQYLTLNYGKDPQFNFARAIVAGLCQFPLLIQDGLEKLPVIASIQGYLDAPLTELIPAKAKSAMSYPSPVSIFHADHYMRHNQRRQEHLASLNLEIAGKRVLEVGAGIGDHTSFFLDRNCSMVVTEGRPENLALLPSRFPDLLIRALDLDNPDPTFEEQFEIVYCYGLLYHLEKPAEAIAYMAARCQEMLLLETCVSYGETEEVNLCIEPAESATQSLSGQGCRPTRLWIYNQLKQHFDWVYMPITQPNHVEFPLDWTIQPDTSYRSRAVFIAAKQSIDSPLLIEGIPMQQKRH